MRILKGNEINMQSWEILFQDSPFSTFFQSPECYRFYAELSFLSQFLYAVEEDGELTALVCGYLIAEKGFVKVILAAGLLFRVEYCLQMISVRRRLSYYFQNSGLICRKKPFILNFAICTIIVHTRKFFGEPDLNISLI